MVLYAGGTRRPHRWLICHQPNTTSSTTLQSTPISPAYPGRTNQEVRNEWALAALKEDGSVVTWGDSNYGGDISSVSADLQSGVTQLFSAGLAFAALKQDGSVITWGHSSWGGDSSSVSADLQSGVTQLFSTRYAFAAVKEDGSVVTWGDSQYGGDSSNVSTDLQVRRHSNLLHLLCLRCAETRRLCYYLGYSSWGGDSSSVSTLICNPVYYNSSPPKALSRRSKRMAQSLLGAQLFMAVPLKL